MRRLLTVAIVTLLSGVALAGCATNDGDSDTPGGGTTTPTGTTSPGTTPTGTTPGTTPVTGTTPTTPTGTPRAPNPNTYTIMTIGEPESLDPAYDYESAGGQVLSNVYETLYDYNGTSAIDLVPVLAADFPEYSEGDTVLTIPLRQGVKFHDGTDMTADDVVFSLQRMLIMNDPHSPAFIYYGIKGAEEYGHLDPTTATQQDRETFLNAGGIEKVDDHTVRITLAYPDPSFVYRLAYTAASVVSKDAFCANTPNAGDDCFPAVGQTRDAWADENTVGTGAFKLERWVKGQEVVLVRFDDYWGEAPRLERVIIRKVDDINTRLIALRNGDADDVYIPVDHDVDVQNLAGVEIIENPSWAVSFIGFNQKFCGGPDASGFQECMNANSDAVPRGADGTPDPLFFSDINMRKAWAHAFDYETYINEIVRGHGKLLNGALPEGIFGYDASVTAPTRDLELARQFLAQTNHSDGFQVTIFYNQGNTVRESTAALLAENLMELNDNIQADTQGLDWSTAFLPKQRAKALPVFYLGWLPDYAFPDNYVVTFAHSELGIYGKTVGYSNPDLDAKLEALLRETDEQALQQGYSEAVQTLNDDYAFLWLAQASNFHVQRDWVEGYYYNPMHSGAPNAGDFSTLWKS